MWFIVIFRGLPVFGLVRSNGTTEDALCPEMEVPSLPCITLNDADLIVLCSAFLELAEFRMIKLLIIVLWNLHISVIVLMFDMVI